MGAHLPQIKEYLRGSNPRISSAAAMVKTTPPGRGSRLLRPGGADPVHALGVGRPVRGAGCWPPAPSSEDDLGVACYHSKTGAVELYLNHLVDGPGEYVVVDCTAGADSFASGLFTRFDLTILVAEPTRKGVSVYRQWQDYAAGYDVALAVVGNKVQAPRGHGIPARRRSAMTCWPASATSQRSAPWSRAARSPSADLSPATTVRAGDHSGHAGRAAPGLAPGTPARPLSSTSGTPAPGQAPPPARTSQPRSTQTSLALGPHAQSVAAP